MNNINLDFSPDVEVFDANISIGRRHNRRMPVDTTTQAIECLKQAGVSKALTFSTHSLYVDGQSGNNNLISITQNSNYLVPQLVCNPGFESFENFTSMCTKFDIRSIRMAPKLHDYPFQHWMIDSWINWFKKKKISIWISVWEVNPSELYQVIAENQDVSFVLTEAHYRQSKWVLQLLKKLKNTYIELSRWALTDGISLLLDNIDEKRILFGSRFPDSPISPQLYFLHNCNLSTKTLSLICADNLKRLLHNENH